MIPESFIQDLLARVDIVEVIDAQVPLKKAGANYAACCPFHSERTPSFTVSPTKQFYHCFGCGAHGTAIGFLMEHVGMGFVDAVKDLAQRVGMPVPDDAGFRTSGTAHEGIGDLRAVMAEAARYFREQLKAAPHAVDYLKRRGLTGEVALRYGVGYAPGGWQNLAAVFADYDAPVLQRAGLVIRNDSGRLYDRFRDRIMFPIQSSKGETIAFGGRVLDGGEPKYLNSPETPLFEKGREVFGLPQARAALRERNTAIVVEGYMDVVALAQHKVGHTVATLGTATTPTHVQKLLRQVDHIVFCFDGDTAGRKAAWRALENALEATSDNKRLSFALLPKEHDPDSFIRTEGREAFERFLAQATPLSAFLISALAERCEPGSAEGRAQLLYEARPLLARLAAPGLRMQICHRLAEVTELGIEEVERLCGITPTPRKRALPRAPRRAPSLYRRLASLLLQVPELAAQLPISLLPDDHEDARALKQLQIALSTQQAGGAAVAALLETGRQQGSDAPFIRDVAADLMNDALAPEEIAAEFAAATRQLELASIDRELQQLADKARSPGLNDDEKQEYLALLREKGRILGSARGQA